LNQTTSHPYNPGTAWQVLGELELPVDADVTSALDAWLVEILSPLNLQANMLHKILISAQEAAQRALQTANEMALEHLHLHVYAPANNVHPGQTWGFFAIKRIEMAAGNRQPEHAVEFYLYADGK
jgi:hypothetical protein